MKTVAFTGYRPEKMPFAENKKDEAYLRFREAQLKVINRLIERGYTSFISGAAQGFDTWVAEDILTLRKKNKELSLECAIPFPDQAKKWPLPEQIRRHKIISHADSSVTLSEHYHRDCFFARNRYMVDKADVVVCDGFTGNVILKVIEGVSSTLFKNIKRSLMRSLKTKIGALLVKSAFGELKKKLDYSEHGGALLLGTKYPIIKGHGASDSKAVFSAIRQAMRIVEADIISKIEGDIEKMTPPEV